MNANQIMNLVMRMFMRKIINRGMDAGMKKMSGMGKQRKRRNAEEPR